MRPHPHRRAGEVRVAVAVLEGDARPVGPSGKAKGGGKIAKSLVPNSVVFQWGGVKCAATSFCRIIRTKVQQPFHPSPDGTSLSTAGHTIGRQHGLLRQHGRHRDRFHQRHQRELEMDSQRVLMRFSLFFFLPPFPLSAKHSVSTSNQRLQRPRGVLLH